MLTNPTKVSAQFLRSLTDTQIHALYQSRVTKWERLQDEPSRRVEFFRDVRAGRLILIFEGEFELLFPESVAA